MRRTYEGAATTTVTREQIAFDDSIARLQLATVRELSIDRLPSASEPRQQAHSAKAATTREIGTFRRDLRGVNARRFT